jgi:hypothetical protein
MSYLGRPKDNPVDILQNARTSLRNSVGVFNNLPRNNEQIILTANEKTGVALDFGIQKANRHSSLTNRYMVLDIQAARQPTNPDGMTPSDTTRQVTLGDDGIFEDFLQEEFAETPRRKQLGFVAKNPYVLSRKTFGKTESSMDNFRFDLKGGEGSMRSIVSQKNLTESTDLQNTTNYSFSQRSERNLTQDAMIRFTHAPRVLSSR